MDFNLQFLEYLSDAAAVLDEQRVFQRVNPALEKLLDLPRATLLGKKCFEVFQCHSSAAPIAEQDNPVQSGPDCPLLGLRQKQAPELPSEEEPLSLTTSQGEQREVFIRYVPLNLAEASASYLVLLQDRTVQKLYDRIQGQFVATASHQLRTPLANFKTSLSVLMANTGPEFPPPLHKLLENMAVSSERMERIVNDLIELTSLQSGRISLHTRPVQVDALLKEVAASLQEILKAKGQKLNFNLNLPTQKLRVEADKRRVTQLLGYLLSNACKFSPPASTITLGARLEESGDVVLWVRDEGIGIKPEEHDFIFYKFYQMQIVENTNGAGGGLGLALAKSLIELHGGRLWFESKPGSGSTFFFNLPQPKEAKDKLDGR